MLLILGKKGISVRKIVSKTRQKVLDVVVMNHQSPLKSLLSEGFCEFLTKEMQAPTHIPRLFSAASPAKRVAVESEEIPTIVQFSVKPETERWWEFLSCNKWLKSIFSSGV